MPHWMRDGAVGRASAAHGGFARDLESKRWPDERAPESARRVQIVPRARLGIDGRSARPHSGTVLEPRWVELWITVTPIWAVLAGSRVLFYALERLRYPAIVLPVTGDVALCLLFWPLVVAGCYLILATWNRAGLPWAGVVATVTTLVMGALSRPTYQLLSLLLGGAPLDMDLLRGAVPKSWSAWLACAVEYGVIYLSSVAVALGFLSFRRLMNERLLRTQVEAAAAQDRLRALRAQLNPHFLFNALNSLMSVTAGLSPAAEQLIRQVSDLFRYTLRASERETHELQEELAYLKSYLTIQQLRHPSRLAWRVRCAPTVSRACVPTLILQPLVENAVIHGMRGGVHAVAIEITAEPDSQRLVLTVSNTFRSQAGSSGVRRGSGLGLRHVRERLEMMFGELANLEVAHPVPDRFVATVVLPLERAVSVPENSSTESSCAS